MKASELQQDTKNFNKGTKRGKAMVADSLAEYGAGRSVLVDRDNRIVCGNKTCEAAGDMPIRVVETDGTELVVVKRTDLSLDDKAARELALADNRSAQLGLEWDTSTLKTFQAEIDMEKFFKAAELKKLFGEPGEGDDEMPPEGYGLLIEEISEEQQIKLLEDLTAQGYKCRAMIF